jgi:rubredoxin
MAKKRKMIWRKEAYFEGWACSVCGWVRSNPRLVSTSKTPSQDVQEAFDAHVCGESHPQKLHEDMNQAAARIDRKETGG